MDDLLFDLAADLGDLARPVTGEVWGSSGLKDIHQVGPRAPERMSKVENMAKKKPRTRRAFTPEFKAEIVGACRRGDRSIGQVARDFDLTETAATA